VKDSRPTEDNSAIRRRRFCPECGSRFTTFERVQLRDLVVVKRSGKRAPFDRDKLARSLQIALRKRAVENERLERVVNSIVRRLESSGDQAIRDMTAAKEMTPTAISTVTTRPEKGLRVCGRRSLIR